MLKFALNRSREIRQGDSTSKNVKRAGTMTPRRKRMAPIPDPSLLKVPHTSVMNNSQQISSVSETEKEILSKPKETTRKSVKPDTEATKPKHGRTPELAIQEVLTTPELAIQSTRIQEVVPTPELAIQSGIQEVVPTPEIAIQTGIQGVVTPLKKSVNKFNENFMELSFHMKLFDRQLDRIKRRTEKLKERDIQIREHLARVRRKAKRFAASPPNKDDDFTKEAADCEGFTTPLRSTGNEIFNGCEKETEDIGQCVKWDKSVLRGTPKHKGQLMGPFSMCTPYSLGVSPRRLKQHKLYRKSRRIPSLTSPLSRGMKFSKTRITNTKDIIFFAFRKDGRKGHVC